MNAATANRHTKRGQNQAANLEPTLQRQYQASLRATAKRTTEIYRRKATVLLAAADPHHIQPTVDEIFDGEIAAASATARTQSTRRRLVVLAGGPILENAGLAKAQRDFYAPLVQTQAGKQAERLVAGTRDTVASIMLDALTEGWSVPETSAELLSKLTLDADWRATMLARTDLVSLGNGAAHQAAQSLGEAGPQFKSWITAGDDRVRPDHADAEGQVVGIDETFDIGGSALSYPGDPDGPDDQVISCRCSTVFIDSAGAELSHSDEGGITAALARIVTGDEEDEMSLSKEAYLRYGGFEEEDAPTREQHERFLAEKLVSLTAATISADERKAFAKSGVAMSDGSYPIRNASDLSNAIHAIGRGSGSHADIRAHIVKRAKTLGLTKSLPKDWNVTASAMTADASGLCDLLDSTLAQLAAGVDTAFTLAQAIRTAYEAEEVAEGAAPQAIMASAALELLTEEQREKLQEIASGIAEHRSESLEDLEDRLSLTAAAAGLAPVAAPSDWFSLGEPDEPTALTITADGQVYGHAAIWDSCHTGFAGRCTTPPKSRSGYGYFHLGIVDTEDGQTIPVGRITMDTGHAGLTASRGATSAHYDHSGTQAAYVRAVDGKLGIWVTGTLNPDLPETKVRALKAAALSGDWRNVNGSLELIGLLAVNVPGFPVPRPQMALAASGGDEGIEAGQDVELALVAAGIVCDCDESELEPSLDLDSLIEGAVDERTLRLATTAAA